MFKNAEYIIGAYTAGQRQGYVLRTEVVSITVNWLSFNPLALDQTPGVATPPRILDDFENIVVYKSVEQHCTYELQDRVKITDPDLLRGKSSAIVVNICSLQGIQLISRPLRPLPCSHVYSRMHAFVIALGLKEYCPFLKSKHTRLQCPDKTHNHGTKFATDEMVGERMVRMVRMEKEKTLLDNQHNMLTLNVFGEFRKSSVQGRALLCSGRISRSLRVKFRQILSHI